MSQKVDIAVIGGGFAGLATAYFLARDSKLRIVVLEQEKKLGGHASGRNAGMIRQALTDPYLVRLAKEGKEALKTADRKGWSRIQFQANGSLLLAGGDSEKELKKTRDALRKQGILSHWLSRDESVSRVSVLGEAKFSKALFSPTDAMVDIKGLLQEFIHALKTRGVRVLSGRKIQALSRTHSGFLIRTAKQYFYAKKVVNAAGAWAGIVGEKANATVIPFKAYRRHLFYADPVKGFKKAWPFVWDLSHEVYFRPQGKKLMLSPCDKILFRLDVHKRRGTGTDPKMQQVLIKKLRQLSGSFEGLKIRSKVAGLRTMVPDGRFVIGEDPKLKGFYWVAGLGGHGVTTAFSVGRLASDLILGRKREKSLIRVFSPRRFLV